MSLSLTQDDPEQIRASGQVSDPDQVADAATRALAATGLTSADDEDGMLQVATQQSAHLLDDQLFLLALNDAEHDQIRVYGLHVLTSEPTLIGSWDDLADIDSLDVCPHDHSKAFVSSLSEERFGIQLIENQSLRETSHQHLDDIQLVGVRWGESAKQLLAQELYSGDELRLAINWGIGRIFPKGPKPPNR